MAHSPAPAFHPRVLLDTLGCKLNLADTELLAQDFHRAGFQVVPQGQAADVYVLNTCTVTHIADQKARQRLRAMRRRLPHALIVATGCYPERDRAEVAAIPGVDLVAGNTLKSELVRLVRQQVQDRLPAPDTLAEVEILDLPPRSFFDTQHTRAFVKIQEGCNDYCAYCIIPKTRGTSRYFSPDEIASAIQAREAAGFSEVVLTGTQLGDYGISLPGSRRRGPDQRDQASEGEPLAELIGYLLEHTEVPRLRISSLQPQDITPGLLVQWQDPRLCNHFHLPLQSGSDAVLRVMRRRYRAHEYAEAVERLRCFVPDVSITTDVIVGFPGESEADFEASYQLCEQLALSDLHVFPYSPRPGTLAARLGDTVPGAVKQARVQRLLTLGERLRQEHQQRFVGTVRPVLWEEVKVGEGGRRWQGLTDNYLRVSASSVDALQGHITPTRIFAREKDGLQGQVLA